MRTRTGSLAFVLLALILMSSVAFAGETIEGPVRVEGNMRVTGDMKTDGNLIFLDEGSIVSAASVTASGDVSAASVTAANVTATSVTATSVTASGIIETTSNVRAAGVRSYGNVRADGFVWADGNGLIFGSLGVGSISADALSDAGVKLGVEGNLNIHEGNIGIGMGWDVAEHPLQLGSGAHVTAEGVWENASSRAFKENIQQLTAGAALAALTDLQPVRFNYKKGSGDEYVGFIAEDVPDLVASESRTALSPMDIVAVLTKVVQEQQKQIDELKARLDAK